MRNLKDIFVDTNLAKNFCNPIDEHLREFIRWLFLRGALVVTHKVIREYSDTCQGAKSQSSILLIIAHQTSKGRLASFGNEQLRRVTFTKAEHRIIESNREDHEHLKAIVLSRRRLVLTLDNKFAKDVKTLPKIRGIAESKPENIPYRINKPWPNIKDAISKLTLDKAALKSGKQRTQTQQSRRSRRSRKR